MTKPPWEVADVIRMVGARFLDSLNRAQLKVLNAIARCRTAALGGHRDQCVRCGYQAITFHSCRNRHCPKCQVNAREKWLRKRQQELLPVGYYHIVFRYLLKKQGEMLRGVWRQGNLSTEIR